MSRIPETKISVTAAQALWEKMRHYDRELDERVKAVNAAAGTIAAAHASAQEIYAKRREIASELDRLAPDDFPGIVNEAKAGAFGKSRFGRANPLPPAGISYGESLAGVGKSRYSRDDEDDEI